MANWSASRELGLLTLYVIFTMFILKMKPEQIHDKLNVRRTRKKSVSQMGLEPTTLRDLVGCSNH